MYYPFLRGRQNELLAIKELLKCGKLSKRVIPVVEPVKLSPTLISTLEAFSEAQHPLVLIHNPIVGDYEVDRKNPKNKKYADSLGKVLSSQTSSIQRGVYVDESVGTIISSYTQTDVQLKKVVAICLNPDQVKNHEKAFSGYDVRTMVPYSPAFRRIRGARILLENKFNKRAKNSDYLTQEDEFFSDDHLYYSKEGYVAFSDYTIVGDEYVESGFAPYAVAIHIVYFDKEKILRVHHFVSDENDDISDPGGKFYQAVKKFHHWHKEIELDTLAAKEFEIIYAQGRYPGLGYIKKLSIMNHLELISQFMEERDDIL